MKTLCLTSSLLGAILAIPLPAGAAEEQAPSAEVADKRAGDAEPAEPDVEPTPPPVSELKDLVRLKGGSLIRGVIIELLKGESVTITSASGKTRTFPMAEVEYAGPASEDPGTETPVATSKKREPKRVHAAAERDTDENESKPYVTVHSNEARLWLRSNPPNLTFHRHSATAVGVKGFSRICTAPCEVSLPAGTETLGLSGEDQKVVEVDPVTIPEGNHELRGKFVDRSGFRIAGAVIFFGGIVTATALVLSDTEKNLNTGLALIGVSALGGCLGFVPDTAEIEVAPSEVARARPRAPGVRYTTLF
jgi:hypothetical protein